MKKILITTIALAVVAAGSVTAFLAVKNSSDKKQQALIDEASKNNIFSFDSETITTVRISCDDGDFTAEYNGEKWIMAEGEDPFDLDQNYFMNICTYFSNLTADTNYGSATDENKSMYGLDDPDTITLSDGTNEYTVYVGAQSPTGESYYIMADGKPEIFAVDSLNGSVLIASRMMMKTKNIIPYSDREVHGIKLIRGGEVVYDLKYDAETSVWALPEEYSELTLSQTSVSSMVNLITRLEAQNMLDEHLEDYSVYGFDEPYAEAIFTGSDGTTRKLLFSYYGNDTYTYTHVLFEETGQVAQFYTGDVSFIEKSDKSFIESQVYPVNESAVSEFKLKLGDNINIEAEMNRDESKFILNGVSLSEVSADAVTGFHDFFRTFSKMELYDVNIKADPEYSDPYMVLHYFFTDGTDTLIELIPTENSDGYYMFFNGKYNGIIIGNDTLDGKYSISYFYEKLTELADLG